jgi:5-methylcytosine-specific restriction endonuclease McrA
VLAWKVANPERVKAMSAAYLSANFKKIAAYKAAWASRNPGRRKAALAKYRTLRFERVKAANLKWARKNPESRRASAAAWRAANPEARRIHQQNRRARAAGGRLSKGLAQKLFRLQRGKCPCCRQPLHDDYHLDHIIPLALGGANSDDNMQLLRGLCNQQKKAKHPVDFMRSRGFLL